jgi:hypothetical protein
VLTGSWAEDPPAALGRVCRWCQLVVTEGYLARWHGKPLFLCRACYGERATGEQQAHLGFDGAWRLADIPHRPRPPWDRRAPTPCEACAMESAARSAQREAAAAAARRDHSRAHVRLP